MCSIQSNRTANRSFQELNQCGNGGWEKKLSDFAKEDSVTCDSGLDSILESIKDPNWRKDPLLKNVRKARCGHHRAYISGWRQECKYFVCYVKVHKKKGVDEEQTVSFQRKILEALGDPPVSILPEITSL